MRKEITWWLFGAVFMAVTAIAEHSPWWDAGAVAMVLAGYGRAWLRYWLAQRKIRRG